MGLSHTVSGDIASFRTPSKVPIESLKFHFLPKQEGSGDPSPTNIRPITGWTGLNGRQEGKNLIDKTALTGTDSVWWNGRVVTGYPNHCVTPLIPVKPGTSYYLYRISTNDSGGSGQNYVAYFGQDGTTYIKQQNWSGTSGTGGIYTIPEDVYYIGITIGTSHKDTAILCPSSLSTDYVNYISPRLFPVTFPDGQTIYGGYIDLIAGEIVAEWKAHTFDGTERIDEYSGSFTGGIRLANNTFDDCTSLGNKTKCDKAVLETTTPSDISRLGIRIGGGQYRFYFYVPDSMFDGGATVDKFKTWLSENGMTVVAKLSTPIHIPISAQDIKAFLDHNNFWSDTNDITEVTYAVTESKDILATRKKAMAFDHAHHKKVKWNQLQVDGNFQDISKWEGITNYTNVSESNGIITATCITKPTQFYHTGFRTKNSVGFLAIPYNHKVLVTAYLRSSEESRVRIYGLVGSNGNTYTYGYNYANANMPSNEWVRLIGFIPNRPETPPAGLDDTIIKRFKPLIIGKDGDISTIPNGATLECKLLMAFDLTQMFGLGNEPQTVAEFEHICEINGIDLTTYQPYDEGSDRWLIVP